jgi:phosphatidylserine/phosphatidylglycerophosphate/cardiolipin synthase-like enzyme
VFDENFDRLTRLYFDPIAAPAAGQQRPRVRSGALHLYVHAKMAVIDDESCGHTTSVGGG